MKKYKIVFISLDGTLINTASNGSYPKGIWDMYMNIPLLSKLKELHPSYVFIVSNQSGVSKRLVNKSYFKSKLQYIISCVNEYIGGDFDCKAECCYTDNEFNYFRKPNTGMLHNILKTVSYDGKSLFDKTEMCMIGNAINEDNSSMYADKQTAANYGIDYYDINDFIKMEV